MLPAVDVLLSTYNGSPYLHELMESLCSQDYENFNLITDDDFSDDNSSSIVDSYQERIKIIRVSKDQTAGNRGAKLSFEYLMVKSSAPYIMFCDQDDIWGPEKIKHSLEAAQVIEKEHGSDMPAAVFCDLSLIDADGNPVYEKFSRYHAFNRNLLYNPYYLAYRNPAPGCSMLINKALAQKSLPFGSKAFMHDWWVVLCASFCGKIRPVESVEIKYRIHSSNTMGLERDSRSGYIKYMFSFFNPVRIKKLCENHKKLIAQGKEVFQRHGKKFSTLGYILQLISGRLIIPVFSRDKSHSSCKGW